MEKKVNIWGVWALCQAKLLSYFLRFFWVSLENFLVFFLFLLILQPNFLIKRFLIKKNKCSLWCRPCKLVKSSLQKMWQRVWKSCKSQGPFLIKAHWWKEFYMSGIRGLNCSCRWDWLGCRQEIIYFRQNENKVKMTMSNQNTRLSTGEVVKLVSIL